MPNQHTMTETKLYKLVIEELSKQLNAKVGDEIALTFGRGNENSSSLPSVRLFKVSGLIKHGILLLKFLI